MRHLELTWEWSGPKLDTMEKDKVNMKDIKFTLSTMTKKHDEVLIKNLNKNDTCTCNP